LGIVKRGRRLLERYEVDGRIILKSVLKRWSGRAWSELVWLKLWASGWFLWRW
jgi:hypothetical protein